MWWRLIAIYSWVTFGLWFVLYSSIFSFICLCVFSLNNNMYEKANLLNVNNKRTKHYKVKWEFPEWKRTGKIQWSEKGKEEGEQGKKLNSKTKIRIVMSKAFYAISGPRSNSFSRFSSSFFLFFIIFEFFFFIVLSFFACFVNFFPIFRVPLGVEHCELCILCVRNSARERVDFLVFHTETMWLNCSLFIKFSRETE